MTQKENEKIVFSNLEIKVSYSIVVASFIRINQYLIIYIERVHKDIERVKHVILF